MAISYEKLRNLLFDRHITKKELYENTYLSNDVTRKIEKDEHVNLESLDRIATYLDVDIGDIVERKKPRERKPFYNPDDD